MCRRDDLILRQVYKSFILLLAYQLLLARTFLHSISYCKIKKSYVDRLRTSSASKSFLSINKHISNEISFIFSIGNHFSRSLYCA